jgi:diguanylate cyclase (GGDEF)-like protein/hemerythrin-like metal-binding protein/PAS domain S-box-containing protein
MHPVLLTPKFVYTPDDGASLPMCREIIEKAGVGLAVMDLEGKLHEVNPAFCETTGRSREELLSAGFHLRTLLLPDEVPSHDEGLRALRRGDEQSYRKTVQLVRADGALVWVDWVVNVLQAGAAAPLVLLTAIDVTEQKRVEDAFRDMSFRDPLTKLANRRLLLDRLQTSLARARRERCGVALLFIDLDNFKPVNDDFGHDVGDLLLKVCARRLVACLRPYDTAARFGGDEFVVLIPDVVQREGAERVAERILLSLSEPFITDDCKHIDISASIGIAIYPDNAHSERELLHAGDEAMYLAKKSGRNRIVRCERSLGTGSVEAVEAIEDEPVSGLVHLRWDPSYSSGNVFIDAEHCELFRQSNQLLDLAIRRDAVPAAVLASLQKLMHHVGAHFEHEERLLSEWKYPDLETHALRHRRLLEHAQQVAHLVDDTSIPIGDLLRFLVAEVIHGHMLAEDSKYFELAKSASVR